MSAAFIGCKISLISKSEIRYEGILYTIDTKESTIALAKVRSYGTEDRVTDKPVAPRNEVYEYIIFRASDIKDLIVDDPPAAPAPGLADPAIIQAQSVGGPSGSAFSPTFSAAPGSNIQKQSGIANVLGDRSRGSTPTRKSPSISSHHDDHVREVPVQVREGNRVPRGGGGGRGQSQNNYQRHDNRPRDGERYQNRSVHQNERTDQRRDYDGRAPQQYGRQQQKTWGPRPDGRPNQPRQQWSNRPNQLGNRQPHRPMPIAPTVQQLEDFDFEKANAEFVELTSKVSDLKVGDAETGSKGEKDENQEPSETYNKTKSFFDTISCEAIERSKGNSTRVDRREERKLNQETFGVSGIRRGRGWGNRGYYRNTYNNRSGDQRYDNQHNNRRGGYYRRDGQQRQQTARAGEEGWRNSERNNEGN